MLHITNGDSVAGTFRQTALPGEMIAWRDALHEGPVPAGLTLEEMSRVRAQYWSGRGFSSLREAAGDFAARDRTLAGCSEHEEVVLWFEHDLYDQLQLIQILDWLRGHQPHTTRLSLICIGEFPGIERFHGLGELNPQQLASVFDWRRPIASAELDLASAAWRAFCSPDRAALQPFLEEQIALPFLAGAMRRHLEQFPAVVNGLSRTERQILEAVECGHRSLVEIFLYDQNREDRPFMGDALLRDYVDGLTRCRAPLLARNEGSWSLTDCGQEVLAGDANFVELNGIDRWLGGVHLQHP